MRHIFSILDNYNVVHEFSLNFKGSSYLCIHVCGVCYIDVYKFHERSYFAKGFFYSTHNVFIKEACSKGKMFDILLKLIDENCKTSFDCSD